MREIRIMSENLTNKIAAGEIVIRPLSVIKELVENSIDAESSEITISLKESGISNITIEDNGNGMNESNLKLSVIRHATSKIYDEEEFLKISSLGFRGEALASIFAVSKLQIIASDDGITASKLRKVNDEEFEITKTSRNKGTTIIVDSLFYNVPARFSSLSNPHYELALIVKYVNNISLIHPEIKFNLLNDDKSVFQSYGNNQITDVITSVYTNEISRNMLHIVDNTNNFNIDMFFSNATISKPRKNNIIISVNNRLIKNNSLEKTIIDSYRNYLHTNQYPIIILKIEASYSLLDVNIHPTKQEIRISLMDELIDMISFNIKSKLRKTEYINTYRDEDLINERQTFNYSTPNKKVNTSEENEQVKFNFSTPSFNDKVELISDSLNTQEENEEDIDILDYIGTYKDTYLLFSNENGLFLIDQHAAQERINYEIISKMFREKQFLMQNLLADNIITLTSDEMILIKDKLNQFQDIGIELEYFGINSLKINSADKFYFKASNLKNDIYNIILLGLESTLKFDEIFDDVAILMACKSSIKANQHLSKVEADELINSLKQCKDRYTCPHGRPIIVSFSNYEIEKLFKRVF